MRYRGNFFREGAGCLLDPRFRGLRVAAMCLWLLTLFLPRVVAGQDTAPSGFDSETLHPSSGSRTSVLNLERPEVLGHLVVETGVFIHYADDPVQLVDPDTSTFEKHVIRNRLKAQIGFGLGLFDRLQVNVSIPTVPYQSGGALQALGASESSPNVALADPRLQTKGMLLNPDDSNGFGLGVAGTLFFPPGSVATLNSEGYVRARPEVTMSQRIDAESSIVANVGAMIGPNKTVGGFERGDAMTFGVAGVAGGFDRVEWVGPDVESLKLFGVLNGRYRFPDRSLSSEFHIGARYDLPNGFRLQVGGGPGLTGSVGTPDFRVFTSIHWANRKWDEDSDQLTDRKDRCPETPGIPALEGCPEQDVDDDDIVDRKDECVDEPEDDDGYADDDGCRDADNDGDGISDDEDDCAETRGIEALDGCPEKDDDGDGMADRKDRCPGSPEDRDGYRDDDGCPDGDNDGDGIPDDRDDCSEEVETFNGIEDADGCPDEKESKAKIVGERIKFRGKVHFALDRDSIKPQSHGLLEDVARILNKYDRIKTLLIAGHTDNQGASDYNRTLSEKRAEAVKQFLVDRGVEPERLKAKGFGETQPIASNESVEGRATNRRVEFKILEQSDTDGEKLPDKIKPSQNETSSDTDESSDPASEPTSED